MENTQYQHFGVISSFIFQHFLLTVLLESDDLCRADLCAMLRTECWLRAAILACCFGALRNRPIVGGCLGVIVGQFSALCAPCCHVICPAVQMWDAGLLSLIEPLVELSACVWGGQKL